VKPDARKKFKLTPRQTDVARLVATGTPRKTICDKLKISLGTLQVHLQCIRNQTHTATTAQAGTVLAQCRF